ncbi:hypothetical protein [Prosthecobacter dejongeii]|uniref:Uncharacterized protein n=1 Tax=Prosthecobacter dejongeii TaxID=48465 RepID=A0A7W8DSI3_9BACT|nr:hypothetical protein [Prosthecobacter dejongeii]MBB5040340.1 hypothetical protein [Prosthecobacter dejongeii]
MSSELVEKMSSIFAVASVIMGALLAFVGAAAWYFADRDSDNKKKALERYQTESKIQIAEANLKAQEAKERAALAELEMVRLQQEIKWRLVGNEFSKALEGRKTGEVQIVYAAEHSESYVFAESIYGEIAKTGWLLREMPKGVSLKDVSRTFMMQEAGLLFSNSISGLAITFASDELPGKIPFVEDTASNALLAAFHASGYKPLIISPHEEIRPPKGVIKIVIGPRH